MHEPTIGSLFAGIGGFDLGFERAGFRTAWQVEINPINRAVLADRFPHAKQFEDVRLVGKETLSPVDCITAGFPCQDISNSGSSCGKRAGLRGERSGLFSEVIRILREVQPAWVVLENVPALLHVNDCADFEFVIQSLAECGYLGCFRVLDAQYFGVPQKRRRIFLVARLGSLPPLELLADAGELESLPCTLGPLAKPRPADAWASNTVQAENSPGRFSLGSATFVAHEGRWSENLERERKNETHGLRRGLDDSNFAQAFAAGNALVPQVAEWIAQKIIKEIRS
jgi:DNA (cytosine-5)-methyltransferase 1